MKRIEVIGFDKNGYTFFKDEYCLSIRTAKKTAKNQIKDKELILNGLDTIRIKVNDEYLYNYEAEKWT